MRRACSILFGQRAGLIVFNNAVGLALVFASTAIAVLASPRVGQLGTAWHVDGWS